MPGRIHRLRGVARRRLGRVHRGFWTGGAALVASQLLRVPISRMPAWHALADWLTQLV